MLSWLPRIAVAVSTVAALMVIALLVAAIWFTSPDYIEIGRDARLANWLARNSVEWGSRFELTTINPFQGMGSMLLPVNAWSIPGARQLALCTTLTCRVGQELIYFAELFAATFVLARTLRLRGSASLVAAFLCTMLLFSPFNFVLGLQGWIATSPQYGHTLSLISLMFAAVAGLRGAEDGARPVITALRNGALIAALAALFYLLLIAMPFWNAGMLIGAAIGLTILGLSSIDRATLLWRTAAGFALAAAGYLSGALDFLLSAYDMSVRFAGGSRPIAVNWSALQSLPAPGPLFTGLCSMGITCPIRVPGGELPFGQLLHVWIILGSAACAVLAANRGLRRVGLVVAIAWPLLLLYWTSLAIGLISATRFAPVYAFLPLYPLLAAMAAGGLTLAVGKAVTAISPSAPLLGWGRHLSVWACVAFLGAMTVTFGAGQQVDHLLQRDWASLEQLGRIDPAERRAATLVPATLDYLVAETALTPGAPFRGSVATALGVAGGGLLSAFGLTTSDEPRGQFDAYLIALAQKLGTTLALLDLWEQSIPTLEEYGQTVTAPLKLYEQAFLTRPGVDPAVAEHFVLVRAINVPVLESLGVRFVLTDGTIPAAEARLHESIDVQPGLTLRRGITLRLYELLHPNVGNVSPAQLRFASSAMDVITAIRADPTILKRVAMVSEEIDATLVPATRSSFAYVRQGATLDAGSTGTSALLLPMQFSNCMIWTVTGPGSVTAVVRTNLLHTLVVFSGDVHVQFVWKYGFGADSRCRKQDAAELDALGVKAAVAELR